MAREKVDNKLNVVIGTKAQVEADNTIPDNSIVIVTDEELKANEIVYDDDRTVEEAIFERTNMVNVTYQELKQLRDSSNLIAGMKYRITDYEFTTNDPSKYQSANHQFDIIVEAMSENSLNDNAFADHHVGDTYFQNTDFSKWSLKYTLDNDLNNFEWAKIVGHKLYSPTWGAWLDYVGEYEHEGVVYKQYGTIEDDGIIMLLETFDIPSDGYPVFAGTIEENTLVFYDGNEFAESISVVIHSDEEGKGVIYKLTDEFNNTAHYDFKNVLFLYEDKRVYTFCNNLTDLQDATMPDEYGDVFVRNNYLGRTKVEGEVIPMTIFTTTTVYNNVIGDNHYNNIILGSFTDNNIGDYFYENTIGNDFSSNTIGHYFTVNTIGAYFSYNIIGSRFNNNTIGNNFNSNTIGNDFSSNTIGNSFLVNSIGSVFSSNTIGNGFYHNTIGIRFYDNTIGENFYHNTIGNEFDTNIVGGFFYSNTVGNYIRYITFSVDGTMGSRIQYLYLNSGLIGASYTNKLDLYFTGLRGRNYPTTIERIANGNIVSIHQETPLVWAGKKKTSNTSSTWEDI